MSSIRTSTITVASGATVSTAFVASGFSSFGLITPSGMEGTTVTFEVGYEASGTTTWTALTSSGTSVPLVVAANKAYVLPADLQPWSFFRLITDQQTEAASFIVVAKSDG